MNRDEDAYELNPNKQWSGVMVHLIKTDRLVFIKISLKIQFTNNCFIFGTQYAPNSGPLWVTQRAKSLKEVTLYRVEQGSNIGHFSNSTSNISDHSSSWSLLQDYNLWLLYGMGFVDCQR